MHIDVLTPSRGRPHRVRKLLTSICDTAANLYDMSVWFRVDDDDPETLNELQSIRKEFPKARFKVGPRLKISGDWWNDIFAETSGEIVMQCGDDIVFESEGWDDAVRTAFAYYYPDGIGLVYGDDGIQHMKLATHSFAGRKGAEILGYYLPPFFEHLFNDTWLFALYKSIGRAVYLPEVKTEHHHWTKYPEETDEIYSQYAAAKRRSGRAWAETLERRTADAQKLADYIKEAK